MVRWFKSVDEMAKNLVLKTLLNLVSQTGRVDYTADDVKDT